MDDTYSLYEAKAKLSEIVRRVREHGGSAIITYHGNPVAEIRPYSPAGGDAAARLDRLEAAGALVRGEPGAKLPPPIVRRRGALARFLEDRDA